MRHRFSRFGLLRRWLTVTTALTGALSVLAVTAPVARANPEGGTVVQGAATITQTNPQTVTVNQTTDRAVINWPSFNIGTGETVRFNQPSSTSATLNRVTGDQVSNIQGNLSANGRVYLVNPNGIVFGAGSKIDVAALVASTADIKTDHFMAGNLRFDIPGKAGAEIINRGTITAADGGLVALISPVLRNSGIIQARLGKVALASANGVTLDLYGDNLILFQAADRITQQMVDTDGRPVNTAIDNSGQIYADGGRVLMTANTAKGVVDSAINTTGLVSARTVEQQGGEIVLLGEDGGSLMVSGTLDASAPDGGNGGFIETSAEEVAVAENTQVSTQAPFGETGRWLIDPTDYTIGAGGNISGAALGNFLNSTHVEIQTVPSGSGNGDIFVNDAVIWSTLNQLTLTAHRDIRVNKPITGTGGGSVRLRADKQGTGAGSVYFDGTGHVTVASGAAVGIYYNPVSYSHPGTKSDGSSNPYSQYVTRAGSPHPNPAYMLVNNVNQLQAMNTNLDGHYALGRDIDASATAGWNDGKGFLPISGNNLQWKSPSEGFYGGFSGTINGDGKIINSLNINFQDQSLNFIGLIGVTNPTSIIKNLSISGGSILGYGDAMGSFVGYNMGQLTNVSSSAILSRPNGDALNYTSMAMIGVGGVVGLNRGVITKAKFSGEIINTAGSSGGIAGYNDSWNPGTIGVIEESFNIGGVSSIFGYSGGIVGANYGLIKNAWNGGIVDAPSAGGIAGANVDLIENTFNTGRLPAYHLGGTQDDIVGFSPGGAISNSFWLTSVNGKLGGLTSSQMVDKSNFTGFDFSSNGPWVMGGQGPQLRMSSTNNADQSSVVVNPIPPSTTPAPPPGACQVAPATCRPPGEIGVNEINPLPGAGNEGEGSGGPYGQSEGIGGTRSPVKSSFFSTIGVSAEAVGEITNFANPMSAIIKVTSLFSTFSETVAGAVFADPESMLEKQEAISKVVVDLVYKEKNSILVNGSMGSDNNKLRLLTDQAIGLNPEAAFGQELKSIADISGSISSVLKMADLSSGTAKILKELPNALAETLSVIASVKNKSAKLKEMNELLLDVIRNGNISAADLDKKILALNKVGSVYGAAEVGNSIKSIVSMVNGARKAGRSVAELNSIIDGVVATIVTASNALSFQEIVEDKNLFKLYTQEIIISDIISKENIDINDFVKNNKNMKVLRRGPDGIFGGTKLEEVTIVELYGMN